LTPQIAARAKAYRVVGCGSQRDSPVTQCALKTRPNSSVNVLVDSRALRYQPRQLMPSVDTTSTRMPGRPMPATLVAERGCRATTRPMTCRVSGGDVNLDGEARRLVPLSTRTRRGCHDPADKGSTASTTTELMARVALGGFGRLGGLGGFFGGPDGAVSAALGARRSQPETQRTTGAFASQPAHQRGGVGIGPQLRGARGGTSDGAWPRPCPAAFLAGASSFGAWRAGWGTFSGSQRGMNGPQLAGLGALTFSVLGAGQTNHHPPH